ncbi:MAG TPA: antitoxin [Microlunatus sp.]|nr:antitoxin [Microlunatus sp.]
MGIFDKAKDLINEHNDKVDQGIDKAAEIIDQKTGGQHSEQVKQGAQQAKNAMDDVSGRPRD